MPLTDAKIRALKPVNVVKKLSDGGGLQLWVMPSGGRLWNVAYRFEGKQKKLALGPYPDLTLQQARQRRDEAKALLASGTDPGQQKRIERISRANISSRTFDVISGELMAKKAREGRAAATLSKTEWLLSFASPVLGNRPIADITAAEVLEALRRVEKRGRLESARRLRSVTRPRP